MNEELKVFIRAEIDDLKKSMREAVKSIRSVGDEAEDSSDKLDGLTATVARQTKELQDMKRRYADIVAEQGEFSDEAKQCSREIESLSGELKTNKTRLAEAQKAADKFDKSLENIGDAAKDFVDIVADQQKELNALKRKYVDIAATQGDASDAAKDCAEEITRLSKALKINKDAMSDAQKKADKLDESLDDVEDEAEDVEDQMDDTSRSFKDGMSSMGSAAKTAVTTVLGVITAIAAALIGVAESTKEFREEQNKLIASYNAVGISGEKATQVHRELFSVIGEYDQATEAAQQIALMGYEEQELTRVTNIAAGVIGRFGDALPVETLYEGWNETLQLKEATGGYLQVLEGAGVDVDEFNEKLANCATEEDRQILLLETMESVLGGAGEGYRDLSADMIAANEATYNFNEAMAGIGESATPIITDLKNMFAELSTNVLQPMVDDLIPVLQEGLEGVKEVIASEDFSVFKDVWSRVLENIVELNDEFNGELLPVILDLIIELGKLLIELDDFITNIETITGWDLTSLDRLTDLVQAVTDVVWLLNAAFDKLNDWLDILSDKFDTKEKELKDIGEEVEDNQSIWSWWADNTNINIFNVIGQIAEAIGAIQDFVENWDEKLSNAKQIIQSFKNTVTSVFTNIKDSIKEKMDSAAEKVRSAIEKIKKFFDFKWELPKLKMPNISISGKFSLNPIQVPKFRISWNKLGGVFDDPTLFSYGGSLQGLGEDGAEAVVPLEKNTKWLDRLAEMLNDKQGNRPIILQVDGKTFAQISVDSINALTRQTGTLGINLI